LKLASRKTVMSIPLIALVLLLLFCNFVVDVRASEEPSLVEVLHNLGFTNIVETDVETFPVGTYNITLYAEFADFYNENELSYYEVNTAAYTLIYAGPDGGYGYISPPLARTFTPLSQFGISLFTPEGHRYFTEQNRNPDGQNHSKVYRNLDDPNMFLVGIENLYAAGDRDYQDMIFSLQPQHYLDVVSPYSTPSGEGWYYNGTTAHASLAEELVDHGNGTRRIFVDWSGDASGIDYSKSEPICMDRNKTAIANWRTQYQFTLRTSGLGVEVTKVYNGTRVLGTATDAAPFTGWFGQGDIIQLDIDSPIIGVSTRHVFTEWTGDASGSGRPFPITMDSPKDVTVHYGTQYEVTFMQTGLDSSATGTVVYVDSAPKTYGDLPYSFWVDYGTVVAYSYNSMISSSVVGKRFALVDVTGPASPITVTSPVVVIGNYKTQYLLTVLTFPSGLSPQPTRNPEGEAGPANGWWYDASTSVILTAQSVRGFIFDYWDVDGYSQGAGVNPITVDMNSSKTATAHYTVPPLGGYSASLTRQVPKISFECYTTLLMILSFAIILIQRRRKIGHFDD